MKKLYTLFILYIFISVSSISFAQKYGKVLYRINCGGWFINSIDTSNRGWLQDDAYGACPFVDTNVVGDKTFGVNDPITLSVSVPASTPANIFKTERDLSKAGQDRLGYNFPIAAGQEIEVRLYFSENYFFAPNQRLMDVYVEGNRKISNFDIFAEVGRNVGLMKKYIVTINDGNLDIDIKQVQKLAMINGIEIVEVLDATVQGVFAGNYKSPKISVYPNPFTNEIKIENTKLNIGEINIYDAYGKEISVDYNIASTDIIIDLGTNPKGIYFLKIVNEDNNVETIKIIKD